VIAELIFLNNGVQYPTLYVDCCGNLVRSSNESFREGELIPGSTEIVSSANEINSPLAWTVTVEAIEKRLSDMAPLMPGLLEAYPFLKVSVSPFPFAPKIECTESDEVVSNALEMVAKHGEAETAQVIEYLNQIGIFKIPAINQFNAAIHEPADGAIVGDEIEVLADGWYSHMKIYRKSVVR
jgi:hypothetical protein